MGYKQRAKQLMNFKVTTLARTIFGVQLVGCCLGCVVTESERCMDQRATKGAELEGSNIALMKTSLVYLTVRACVPRCFSRVQLCVTPCTVACQAPLSMGILQARILEWVAVPSSSGPSQPRDQTCTSCRAGQFFTTEPPRKPIFPQDDNNKLYTLDFFHVPKYESLAISILHC